MMKKSALIVAALVVAPMSLSQASTITATVTADNSWALYTGTADGSSLSYVGRNVNHWMTPSSYTFTHNDGDYLYLAAWSDNSVAQGILGQFVINGSDTLVTGSAWQSHLTHSDINDFFSMLPAISHVQSEIDENTWGGVSTLDNGVGPWGTISSISSTADWIWGSALIPGSGYGEYQIFRHRVGVPPVPEPGVLGLMGLGIVTLGFATRRRKSK